MNNPQGGVIEVPPHNPYSLEYINNFWAKVRKEPGKCWIWLEGVTRGYGAYSTGGKRRLHHLAHRYSYILTNGTIPDNLYVLHKCDTPRCVNPEHLFLGTAQDNARDAASKGRTRRSNFSASFIQLIKSELAAGRTQQEIAARHFISAATVSFIKHNKVNPKREVK